MTHTESLYISFWTDFEPGELPSRS